jgi:hypothetical protein
MAERDTFTELAELARFGEQYADPIPAAHIRARGAQRRRRRHGLVAATVAAAVVLAGGAILSGSGLGADRQPSPAVEPTISAVPQPSTPAARRIVDTDLLTAAEVPLGPNYDTVTITNTDLGRQPDELSACQPGPASLLGARQALPRNFRGDRADSPRGRLPDIYTLTLQFDDAAQTARAQARYVGWLSDCATRLEGKGYRALRPAAGNQPQRTSIKAGQANGAVYDLVYLEPGQRAANGTFENVGLLPVGDRLVIMVRVAQGQDDNAYYLGTSPVDGLQQHPFYAMMTTAAKKLA